MNWYVDVLLRFFVEHPLLSFILLFIEFVVIMKIHHKTKNEVLHKILAIFFIPQDLVANFVFITLVGLELPKPGEWLVTARMKRWKTIDPTEGKLKWWRHTFATKLCEQLNKYDAGHC